MIRMVGRALRARRAGADKRVAEDPRFAEVPRTIVLESDAFADGAPLPPGKASPQLRWRGVPDGTVTLVLIVEDVDVPIPRPATHAVAYAIPPALDVLDEGALTPERMTMGKNIGGRRRFAPATPLPGHGAHRYVFTLLAVDFAPHFDQPPSRGRILDAIAGHVIALGELTGTRESL
jgi:Raf kinase inhibitor-like YbhB/YbcL family protein